MDFKSGFKDNYNLPEDSQLQRTFFDTVCIRDFDIR